MATNKRPELYLSAASLAGVVGSAIYFQKKLQAQQTSLEELDKRLNVTITKVADMPQRQNLVDVVHAIQDERKLLQDTQGWVGEIQEIVTTQGQEIVSLQETLREVVSALADAGYNIETKKSALKSTAKPVSRDGKKKTVKFTRQTGRKVQPVQASSPLEVGEDDDIDAAVRAAQGSTHKAS